MTAVTPPGPLSTRSASQRHRCDVDHAGMSRLPVGTGRSTDAHAADAGRAAARLAVDGLDGAEPGLVLVWTSTRYEPAELLAGVREVTGDAPVVGASSAGQLCDGSFLPREAGVVVVVLGAGTYRFGTALVTDVRGDGDAAGRRLAREAIAAAGPDRTPHGTLLLLTVGLTGNLESILSGVHHVAGAAVPVVGGAAAVDRWGVPPYVLHGGQAHVDAAVAVWIGGDRPLTVVSGHGWEPVGLPMLVTRVDGQTVHELGGRPAMQVYEEFLRSADPSAGTAAAAVPGAASDDDEAHLLGLVEPDGSLLVRTVYSEDGDLRTFAQIPPYSAVQVVRGDADRLLAVSEDVVRAAFAGAAEPAVLLVFSCTARMDLFGERAPEEAERLQAAAGSVPTAGFYTFGEFARTTSASGYHNATVVAVAL